MAVTLQSTVSDVLTGSFLAPARILHCPAPADPSTIYTPPYSILAIHCAFWPWPLLLCNRCSKRFTTTLSGWLRESGREARNSAQRIEQRFFKAGPGPVISAASRVQTLRALLRRNLR